MEKLSMIYMSNSYFGSELLKGIHETGEIKTYAVITAPDKRRGRGNTITPGVVKKVSEELKLEIIETIDPNYYSVIREVRALSPSFILVCDYGKIVSMDYHGAATHGCFNIHPSLLPRYRGPNPIREAIYNGDLFTGVSYIKISQKLDAGNIICNAMTDIGRNEIFKELQHRLINLTLRLFKEFIGIIRNRLNLEIEQNFMRPSFSTKIDKSTLKMNWNLTAERLHNLIRGNSSYPGSFFIFNDKKVKIIRSSVSNHSSDKKPGSVFKIDDQGLYVQTGRKSIIVKEIHLEGKSIMQAKDFVNGYKITTDTDLIQQ